MKRIFTIIIFLSFFFDLKAQSAKVVYGEIGGPGLASLNVDTRFNGTNSGFGARIGLGGFSINNTGLLLIPVGINYLLSNDQKNCLELGAGISFLKVSLGIEDSNESEVTPNSSFGYLWLGYRLQPIDDGICFRAGICPLFGSGTFIPYYAGISLGYKF